MGIPIFSDNMIVLVLLALISASLAGDPLREVLKSPKATLQLYSDFKMEEGLKYGGSEDRLRFRLFRHNAEFVAELNEQDETAVFGLNFFSSLTGEERKRYLGLNVTGHLPNEIALQSSVPSAPSTKLWTNEGAVTSVKNQGSCGSCWTFGAVGGLETRYKNKAGRLRNFAEQEYLDCVYEGRRDGCQGGRPSDCYDYSKKAGGRLASAADYSYTARDRTCKASSTPDSMVASKITFSVAVGSTEAANIAALATGSISVAFEVTNKFQQYRGGIIKDTTCHGWANHAVTAVGYTPTFVLVKNSWGSRWGDNGFVKFTRGYANCGLFRSSFYPKLESTSKHDTNPSDKATSYRPDDSDDAPKPDPNCRDQFESCEHYKICSSTRYDEKYKRKWCSKSCGFCGGCPAGTVKCKDGICRHEHMC